MKTLSVDVDAAATFRETLDRARVARHVLRDYVRREGGDPNTRLHVKADKPFVRIVWQAHV
jgi:hypothetical protein